MMCNSLDGKSISSITDECIVVLNDEERDMLKGVIDNLPSWDEQHLDDGHILIQAELATRHIPDRLPSQLINFRRYSNAFGTLLFRNLPVDPILPPTPDDGRASPTKGSSVSEYTLLMLMMVIGDPIGYSDEKDGALVHNICPIAGHEERQENSGSVFFDFHTENAFHPYKPDHLGLYCLRADHDGVTQTITGSIRNVILKLPGRVLGVLREPLYRVRLATSFAKDTSSPIFSPLMPVLSGDSFDPDLCVDFHNTEGITVAARLALDALREGFLQAIVGCALVPGDLIVIDNRVAVHGRTAFTPRYDGKDRWLQRLFVVQDFRRSQASRPRGKHICLPLAFEYGI